MNTDVPGAWNRMPDHKHHQNGDGAGDDTQLRNWSKWLDQMSKALIATGDLPAVLQSLLQTFVHMTRIDAAVIRLREGERMRSVAAVGLEEEVKAGFSRPINEGFAGRVAEQKHAMMFRLSEHDANIAGRFVREKGLQALHCAPLLNGDDLLGILYMGVKENRDFSEPEKELLDALGNCAAATIASHASREQLGRAIQSRDDILAIVAHDLRNPLNAIVLAAHTLLLRADSPAARKPIERIIRGAHRAERLIRDLLEINEIETGRFSIEPRFVEPADIILAALESQQAMAADTSLIIASDISPDLPPIDADEERLYEVLENLIGNALKFTQAPGQITIGAAAQDNEILIWVKDTGAGISADELPHIFDRFWQARKTDRRGTGLGLTVCKAIVEAHGGRIWAESSPDNGTTMYFTVPAASSALAPLNSEPATILLVDDRPENLLSLESILDRPDYRLVTATSGKEALALVLRERFCLALIDIAMPGMTGLEVAVHLKELERSRDIPIIFITAFGDDPEEIHRAYAAGGVDYLVKPLDAEIVRKKVAVFVELNRRRKRSLNVRHANNPP